MISRIDPLNGRWGCSGFTLVAQVDSSLPWSPTRLRVSDAEDRAQAYPCYVIRLA